jgi:leucyl aminopeptidase
MKNIVKSISGIPEGADKVHLVYAKEELKQLDLKKDELKYAQSRFQKDKALLVSINRYDHWVFIQVVKQDKNAGKQWEGLRNAGNDLQGIINKNRIERIHIFDSRKNKDSMLAFAEGMALGNYQFIQYRKNEKDEVNSLKSIYLPLTAKEIKELNILVDAVYHCRDLVNEPVIHLNATALANRIVKMGEASGAKVEVMNKKKIESLKMGGLLAVNKGSLDPPTFTIMEWKPENAINTEPYIFVGKGVVFDTGGMNIKIGNYMDTMKCDMAGAATMASVVYAIAMARLPVYVVALIPATDNRPDGNAYVPGDIIKMYNGMTVEVLNTDAEGRMILADALSYASKYKPKLVFDAATLTGAASRAIGRYGIVAMEAKATQEMTKLKESGERVYERIAEFPFWEEYGELIKSKVADIKNIGGIDAGMITAGKFLEHFTDYPFIHLDIAGPAFIDKEDSYRTAGGTGMGVRLLYDFMKQVSV